MRMFVFFVLGARAGQTDGRSDRRKHDTRSAAYETAA